MYEASLQYVFKYVLSDVRDDEKLYYTKDTCMVMGGPVGHYLRDNYRSWVISY
jgi:hypothetical protein